MKRIFTFFIFIMLCIKTIAIAEEEFIDFGLDSGKEFSHGEDYLYNENTGEHLRGIDTLELVLKKPIRLNNHMWVNERGWFSRGCGGECYVTVEYSHPESGFFINSLKNSDYIYRHNNTIKLMTFFEGTYIFNFGDTKRTFCRVRCKPVDDTVYVPHFGIFNINVVMNTSKKLDTLYLKKGEKRLITAKRTLARNVDTLMWDETLYDLQWKVFFNNNPITQGVFDDTHIEIGFEESGEGFVRARFFDELTKTIIIVENPVHTFNKNKISFQKISNKKIFYNFKGQIVKNSKKYKGIQFTKNRTILNIF